MTGSRPPKPSFDGESPTSFIDAQFHEFRAWLNYEGSLAAYGDLARAYREDDGATFEDEDGTVWSASLGRWFGRLIPPESPSWESSDVPEYVVSIAPLDADEEHRKISYQIKPRWPGQESENGALNGPDFEGVSALAQGSNVDPREYPALLRRAVESLGVDPSLFADPSSASVPTALAAYVRVRRSESTPIHKSGGTLDRIDESVGVHRSRRDLDLAERPRPGYRHIVQVDSEGAGKLIDGHELGKQYKHYFPKYPSDDPDDPLYYPKFEVSYLRSQTDETVYWDDLDSLIREVRESLVNGLYWSEMRVRACDTYVSDDHFSVENRPMRVGLVDDPTDDLVESQDDLIDGYLGTTSRTGSETAFLEAMTDGGSTVGDATSPQELADETGYSRRSMDRAATRLADVGLVDKARGSVRFASKHIGDKARSLIKAGREFAETTTDATESAMSKLAELKLKHGATFPDNDEGGFDIELLAEYSRSELDVILRRMRRAYQDEGGDPYEFNAAQVRTGEENSTRERVWDVIGRLR